MDCYGYTTLFEIRSMLFVAVRPRVVLIFRHPHFRDALAPAGFGLAVIKPTQYLGNRSLDKDTRFLVVLLQLLGAHIIFDSL